MQYYLTPTMKSGSKLLFILFFLNTNNFCFPNFFATFNAKFFILIGIPVQIFLAPFLLGAITVLSFAPYNLTFVNFFTFSISQISHLTKV